MDMRFSEWFLETANSLLTVVVSLFLLTVGAYSVYALWDNERIYSAVEDIQADMAKHKPDVMTTDEGTEPAGTVFDALNAINSDICAWVTLDNTNIDFPVVQGENNLSYINMDIYGNFSLAGSIFLDVRNAADFTDGCSILYGHHMEESGMFGDLDLYKEERFFHENRTGTLILPDRVYDLDIFACLVVSASDAMIFDSDRMDSDRNAYFEYCEQNAIHLHEDVLEREKSAQDVQILEMTTCSSEFTDARTIVLAVMRPQKAQ